MRAPVQVVVQFAEVDVRPEPGIAHFLFYVLQGVQKADPAVIFGDILVPFLIVTIVRAVKVQDIFTNEDIFVNARFHHGVDHFPFQEFDVVVQAIVPFSDQFDDGETFVIIREKDLPDGLIVLSPWSSLPEAAADHYPRWVVGLVVDEKYNSIEAARSVKCPVSVIHCEEDELIPVDHSQRIAASLKGTVQYMRVFDAGHNDLFAQEEVWQQIHAFINTFRNSDFGKQPQE